MIKNLCPWGRGYWKEYTDRGCSRLNYYLLPDSELRDAYKVLEDALRTGRNKVFLCGIKDSRTAENLIRAVVYDNPVLCEFSTNMSYAYSSVASTAIVNVSRNYQNDVYQRNLRTVEGMVSELRGRTAQMTDYEKEFFIYDYLANRITYDLNAPHQFDMFGALVDGRATCQGISCAVTYLMNRLGIDCSTVCGDVMNNRYGHAWNVVNIDGQNYNLDVTFELNSTARSTHAYFNVNDACVSDCKHLCKSSVKCSSMKLNYHNVNGLIAEEMDDVGRILKESLRKNGREYAELRIAVALLPHVDDDYILGEFWKALMTVRPFNRGFSYSKLNGCYNFRVR